MRPNTILFLIFLVLAQGAKSQISQGGVPQELIRLKSAGTPVVEMPHLNNSLLLKSAIEQNEDEPKLKPFKFAHAFNVDFSPKNSGEWYRTVSDMHCWELKIRSKGAYSLNIILDEFMLPPGAKLFVYNSSEGHILGAFTAFNNKSSGKFAIAPVAGDEITVHYEVSDEFKDRKPFTIKSVNHDFVGILKSIDRRPFEDQGHIAGICNVDINCDLGDKWNEVKNAVCRMIVDGVEYCTGSLINNTAEDQKPFIISAGHCYDKWEYAETSIYVFNYESPFCAPLDGDPSNSVSGAIMRAQFDSLDFALAELSLIPPPDYRPYYAGWDRSDNLPDSTTCIHHPWGDIKKMAFDEDSATISNFSSKYIKDGFLKIQRWDEGVTEPASSGGPLFNKDKNIVGTLTGGNAFCNSPVLDYFQRFSLSWDYKADSLHQQLKHWLDPINSNAESLQGKQFYEHEDICGAFTNLSDSDSYNLIEIDESGTFSGYWGGTNNVGVTEFVEKFSIDGNEQLSGVSFGVGKIHKEASNTNSAITVKVYNGGKEPERQIYSQEVLIRDLYADAMNFIGFEEIIEPDNHFFVGFELSNIQARDSFVVYQSLRSADAENTFSYKQNGVWNDFKEVQQGQKSMANVFELVACNIEDTLIRIPIEKFSELTVYPNPTTDKITLVWAYDIDVSAVSTYNLIGQKIEANLSKIDDNRIEIDLTGNGPGIYFIRLKNGTEYVTQKVSFVPW